MRNSSLSLVLFLLVAGCGSGSSSTNSAEGVTSSRTLLEAREGFKTKLIHAGDDAWPPDEPPADRLQLVTYPAAPGDLSAYVTPNPGDGKRHPAIVWITGGDCNSIGDVWSDYDPDNEQSAKAYHDEGLIMMFPSLRGGNDNPGRREGFLGEVSDVLAAAEYLAALDYVDSERIYLGGHSTGGTLVLLVAETSDYFRAVFSFGPVADTRSYGGDFVYCDVNDSKEMALRSPINWLHCIETPTFVFEGRKQPSNASDLERMEQASSNSLVRFFVVNSADHFSVLDPINRLIASRIAGDTGKQSNLKITKTELEQLAD